MKHIEQIEDDQQSFSSASHPPAPTPIHDIILFPSLPGTTLFNYETFQDEDDAHERCQQLLDSGYRMREKTDSLNAGEVDCVTITLDDGFFSIVDYVEVIWIQK